MGIHLGPGVESRPPGSQASAGKADGGGYLWREARLAAEAAAAGAAGSRTVAGRLVGGVTLFLCRAPDDCLTSEVGSPRVGTAFFCLLAALCL